MATKLCEKVEKWKNDSKKPLYVCKKCGLISDKKKKLCKPERDN